jgi:hypothetical protein
MPIASAVAECTVAQGVVMRRAPNGTARLFTRKAIQERPTRKALNQAHAGAQRGSNRSFFISYGGRILNGANPAELPVQAPGGSPSPVSDARHRRAIRVLDLDPALRSSGAAGCRGESPAA